MENQTFQTPEQEELQKKLTELDSLKLNLAQKEYELITLGIHPSIESMKY